MSIGRFLAIVLFGLGLFVQSAAQAAAVPQLETAGTVHCSEMGDMAMEGVTGVDPSEELPCDQMTLDCVIAMGCLAPANIPDTNYKSMAPLRADREAYLAGDLRGLKGRLLTPESPPPQANLDI
ncbi:MAG: hypothetical protein ACN4E6_00575 [Qipengyuania pacifica]